MILKGTCDESPLDWVYYATKNDKSIFYEGYKNSKIILANGSWHMKDSTATATDLIVEMPAGQDGSKLPLGRHLWSNLNTACNRNDLQPHSMTISKCVAGDQFSCNSGECVGIFQRCNKNVDCFDGSDEKNCRTIRIPDSYQKSAPPELDKELEESNPIITQIKILNIDSVDTVSMKVGLTIDIHLTWRDPNLIYENVLVGREKFNTFKMVSEEEHSKIWLPMKQVIHGNGVLGTKIEDDIFYVKVVGKSKPEKISLEESVESLLYEGSENDLTINQRFKLEYRCEFFLANYPFDEQVCNFKLMMNLQGNYTVKLLGNTPPIIYDGPKILTEFAVTKITANATLSEFLTTFTFYIHLERLYMQVLSTTFFQTILLWLIAYFTLYININDFGNRFMGAITSLLVLAALLSSINASLPQTAYFKNIDAWFFFFVINIVIIVFLHIIIDILLNRESAYSVAPKKPGSITKVGVVEDEKRKMSLVVNTAAQIVIPILITLFLFVYMLITLTH